MKQASIVVTMAVGLLALMPVAAQAQDHVIEGATEPSFLYVLSAQSGSVDGDTLTLEAVPSVIYFSDRPERIAGHMTVDAFVRHWDGGVGSFADVPPNAVLSVLGSDDVEDSVVELTDIRQEGDTLLLQMVVLEGSPPQGPIGPASLFLDPDTVAPIITDSV
jgi:hypothetical protein